MSWPSLRAAAQRAAFTMPPLLPAVLIAGLAAVGATAAYYAPPETGEMAVMFAPGTDEVLAWQVVLAAGGSFVAPSRFTNVLIAYAPDPGFADRVRAAGALFTFAAQGLCGPVRTG